MLVTLSNISQIKALKDRITYMKHNIKTIYYHTHCGIAVIHMYMYYFFAVLYSSSIFFKAHYTLSFDPTPLNTFQELKSA